MSKRNREPIRDERGARRPVGGKYDERGVLATSGALIEMLKIGVFGEEITADGVRVRCGRPRKYETPEALIDRFYEYLDYIDEKRREGVYLIPDVEGFALFAGLTRTTLFEWERSRGANFSNALQTIRNGIAACKKQLAMQGKIPPLVYTVDMNNNHGYVQQQTLDVRAVDRLETLPSREEIAKRIPTADEQPARVGIETTEPPETP